MKKVLIVVLVVLIGGVAFYALQSRKAAQLQEKARIEREAIQKQESESMMKDEGAMMEKDAMMKDEGTMMLKFSGTVLAGISAPLIDFNKADYDAAKASDKLLVFYFYANWCPICRIEFPSMQSAFNELQTDKVVGFRVNYNDTATDADEQSIAREFGVAYQHTKVFLKNGERILKSPESWSKERYLNEINSRL